MSHSSIVPAGGLWQEKLHFYISFIKSHKFQERSSFSSSVQPLATFHYMSDGRGCPPSPKPSWVTWSTSASSWGWSQDRLKPRQISLLWTVIADPVHPHRLDPCCLHTRPLDCLWGQLPALTQYPAAAQGLRAGEQTERPTQVQVGEAVVLMVLKSQIISYIYSSAIEL